MEPSEWGVANMPTSTQTISSAQVVSKFLIQNSERVSNLKLQKLLYYAQGWHLGLYSKPLFDERIEAWRHGPVVPGIFHLYRDFKWSPIQVETTPVDVSSSVSKHLKAILKVYGQWTAAQLETQSHTESPWIEARQGYPDGASCRTVITQESMQRYFCKLANA